MATLDLPRTPGCIVCGRNNPHGLALKLQVDAASGTVRTRYTPRAEHIGFINIAHGGVLATVMDEAMVWAATWARKRFCLCGEMTVRYRRTAGVATALTVEAKVESQRSKLIQASAEIRDPLNRLIAEATGKYIPLPAEENQKFMDTMIDEPATAEAAGALRSGAEQHSNPNEEPV